MPEGALYYNYNTMGLYENTGIGTSNTWTLLATGATSGNVQFNSVSGARYKNLAGGFPDTASGTPYYVVGTVDNSSTSSAPTGFVSLFEAGANGNWIFVGPIAPQYSGVP